MYSFCSGRSIKVLANSPSPTMASKAISFASFEAENARSSFQASSIVACTAAEENPSTRTSKDNKASPTHIGKNNHNIHMNGVKQEKLDSDSPEQSNPRNSSNGEDYMNGFKSLLSSSPPKNSSGSKLSSPVMPNAADVILAKKPTVESERENAERVDALLMELFPERFEKQQQGKKGKAKGTKKAGAGAGLGYSKNQVHISKGDKCLFGLFGSLYMYFHVVTVLHSPMAWELRDPPCPRWRAGAPVDQAVLVEATAPCRWRTATTHRCSPAWSSSSSSCAGS